MKNEKIIRDTKKHNEYKKALKQESKQVFGAEKCYASQKQYKGLIASHIKPYKICALEGDAESEFDINNGLLLSRDIDAYFDKLDITFDEDGKIICSEIVPEDIKEEFSHYQLTPQIYNATRKQYMRIHRSLFYYKNYCQADATPAGPIELEGVQIPYYDTGIKSYKNNVIIFENGRWTIGSIYKFKHDFIERTGHQFKYALPSADLAGIFLQMPEYKIEEIPQSFNCPNCSIELNGYTEKPSSSFQLCSTNFDPKPGTPTLFLQLLRSIFKQDEQLIILLRNILYKSMLGEGIEYNVALYGSEASIAYICGVIESVLGTYAYKLEKTNVLYNLKSVPAPIYNCRLLLLVLRSYPPSKNTVENILQNTFFPKTEITVDKYTPLYVINGKKCNLENVIALRCNEVILEHPIDQIVEAEGPMILHWILSAGIDGEVDITIDNVDQGQSNQTVLSQWVEERCDTETDLMVKTPVFALYDDYSQFEKEHNRTPMSLKQFSIELNKGYQKKRYSAGVFYIGIKLKKLR